MWRGFELSGVHEGPKEATKKGIVFLLSPEWARYVKELLRVPAF